MGNLYLAMNKLHAPCFLFLERQLCISFLLGLKVRSMRGLEDPAPPTRLAPGLQSSFIRNYSKPERFLKWASEAGAVIQADRAK